MNAQLTNYETSERALGYLLGNTEKISFQRQLLNAATLSSTIISFVGIFICYIADRQMTPLILAFGSAGVFFVLYSIGRLKRYSVWVVWAYLGFNYLFLVIYWFSVDDYIGIFLPLILIFTCILPILLSGLQLVLAFILNCVVLMAVYFSVIIYPGNIVNQEPSIQYLLEKFLGIILLGAGLSLVTLLVNRYFRFLQDRIKKLTLRDDLTSLYNRRYFNQIFQREINRARRDNKYLSLLMVDIDNFKNFNERYGHETGDEVLIRIARLLMRITTRGSDFVFRMVGEQFAVIFSGLHPEEALEFSEEIRAEVEHLRIEHIGNTTGLFMTVSMGLATILPVKDMNMDWYYHKANEGLKEAKKKGKNAVGVA